MIPFKDNIPVDRFPIVTFGLIVANLVVYVLTAPHGGSLISGPDRHELLKWGAAPDALTLKTTFTHLFVNGSVVQLLGNMAFLWWFGNNVEDSMGPVRFLAFYVAAGLAALGLQIALAPGSAAPAFGPAGAVAGVIGGYVVLYARARLLTLVLILFFFGVIEVPVLVMLALWLAMQAAFGNGTDAYLAALGSLLLGMAAIRLVVTRVKATPPAAPALWPTGHFR